MNVRSLYDGARRALAAVSDDPAFEAVCLTQHFFGMDRAAVLTHGDRVSDARAEAEFRAALSRRIGGEPLQYILGEWDFMALTLHCGPGVLIPRDDTAVLVEAAAKRLAGVSVPRGLDLCAGTGAVGLMLARYPQLAVEAVQGDVLAPAFAASVPGGFDFIVSNPPYIETGELPDLQREVQREPRTALDGGADGLVFYRAVCALWAEKLRSGGVLALEIGETQGRAVSDLFEAAGLTDIRIHKDTAGLDRAVSGVRQR